MIQLNDDHQQVRDMVRDFAENEIRPIAAEIDETKRFPAEIVAKLGELGLLGVVIPEAYGGAGMDTMSYIIVVEELARVCGTTSITVAAHSSLGMYPIYAFGSEEQKKKYIPRLAGGEWLGAFGLTEPSAGSDAQNTQTTAVVDGDSYVINGSKLYMTNGTHAHTHVITARVNDGGQDLGIGAFIIEAKSDKGVVMGKLEDKLGLRASDTRQVFYEDCRIPKDRIMGTPGEGFKHFMKTLDGGRISIGALALGLAQGAYEYALQYAKERQAFGKPLSEKQAIQHKLADMAVEIEAARHLCYNAAKLKDAGQSFALEASFAKLYAAEIGMRVTHQAIQVYGGYGYSREYPVERYFRDMKLCEIGEGTSEIQRMIIARKILKG